MMVALGAAGSSSQPDAAALIDAPTVVPQPSPVHALPAESPAEALAVLPSPLASSALLDVSNETLGRSVAAEASLLPASAIPDDEATATPTPAPAPSGQPSVEPGATPVPTAATDAGVTPQPTPIAVAGGAGGSRCAQQMAGSPGEGWGRALTSSFDEATPLGSWPGPIASKDWRSRQAGATDSSGRGTYDSSKTVSESGGLLDVWIHSAVDGAPHVHNPEGRRYTAAPIPTMGHTLGARVSMCMRADVVPGYKIAFLLWPDEGPGNFHGEIDFPEARLLDHASPTAFMHYAPKPSSGKDQDAYETGVSLQDWHVYTTEWNPTASDPYVKFFLDGALIGHSTEHVPTRPMQLVLQIETFLSGQELPPPAEGHVQIDWVTIDIP